MTVKERDIAGDFKTILKQYAIHTTNNTMESGWADKLIQCPKGIVVAAELKRVFVNKSGFYLLSDLRQSQCAWLAKWQYNGGKCFVFIGLIRDDIFLGYHCKTVVEWKDWLKVNNQKHYAINIKSASEVAYWFEGFISA